MPIMAKVLFSQYYVAALSSMRIAAILLLTTCLTATGFLSRTSRIVDNGLPLAPARDSTIGKPVHLPPSSPGRRDLSLESALDEEEVSDLDSLVASHLSIALDPIPSPPFASAPRRFFSSFSMYNHRYATLRC
jgi:hypothetical protein